MKASALFDKLKAVQFPGTRKKWLLGAGAGLVIVVALGVGLRIGGSKAKHEVAGGHGAPAEQGRGKAEHADKAGHVAADKGLLAADKGLLAAYKEAWQSVQKTVDRLRKADQENEKLKLENAHLRLKLEARQFDCHADDAERATREFEAKLDRETGSKMGRTLASIGYKAPLHLMPAQMYALAASYFKAREDEKAAVLMTFLTGLEDEETYKTPKNLLMTGISWYRLDNYVVAENYFDKALEKADASEQKQMQSQIRLWKALAAERMGKHDRSQRWLRDVLDKDPHSTEAAWVNDKEVARVPAQSKEH